MMRYGDKLFWLKGLRVSEPTMYNDVETFNIWREGRTGQLLVDALMRELKATGFMSNRGRMLVSFYLSKELKVNWQWGAAWFEYLLVDFDVYSNYGNWAYQSGRGTDSRVNRRFNLKKQAEKFDPSGTFVSRWTT
jgi:deoxyribodipyrimidine photo-lyase